MERLASVTRDRISSHGMATLESGMPVNERSSFGILDSSFEDINGHAKKELFQFPTDVMERERAKAPHWQTRFLLLGNPLGESERDLRVKTHSADDVVGAALLFITFVIASVVYGIVKKGDLLFGAPDIEAFFAAIGGGLLFWAVIAFVFVLAMMAIAKDL